MKLLTSKFYQPLLSLAEKAKQNLLPDELSIEDIGNLIYPDDDDTESRYHFFSGLEKACQEKQLAFTGDLNRHEIRPELLNNGEELQRQLENCTHDDYGTENSFAWNIVMLSNVFIHRDELKRYFDLVGLEVPKGCLLLNWWTEADTDGSAGKDESAVYVAALSMETQAETVASKPFEFPETTKNKELAWEIGEAWLKEERRKGENPGIIDVAKHIEKEFKNMDIRGRRGDYLGWASIKKDYITGITGRPANGKAKIRSK